MQFISPCNHPDSYLSGSTIESMVNKHKELGLDYFTCTDHASLTGALKSYIYANKIGVKPILGVEIYFKDNNCDIVRDTESAKIKYFKLIIHAKDQEGYQKLVSKISTVKSKIFILDKEYPAFDWNDLEELSKYNLTVATSDVECMVSKHLLVGRADLGLKYYRKIRDMFGAENFYPTIIPVKYSQYWSSFVEVELPNKTIYIPSNDRIETDKYKKAKAIELTRRNNKHSLLKYIYINKIRYPVKEEFQTIKSAKLVNKFEDIGDTDIQKKSNDFILKLAKLHKDEDRLLINSYSYYSEEGDKAVQNMKLGETVRCYQVLPIRTLDDLKPYLKEELELSGEFVSKLAENSYKWAANFDDFKLDYPYRLVKYDNPKKFLIERIKKVGRMKWNNPKWVKRFKQELEIISENGRIDLTPYFLPIIEVFDYYSKNGKLVGPGRGSAGGFLISYLLGITHIDPFKYELSSARFITLGRIKSGKMPDIDVDLSSRELLVGNDGNSGYLKEKYGDCYAQCSTRGLLRIKSAILDANRFVNKGKVEEEVEKLAKSLPTTPQGVEDKEYIFGYDKDGNHVEGLLEQNEDLQKYAVDRPEEWDLVKRALSLTRQFGRHACFAAGTLVDDNGGVGFIDEAPEHSVDKPITTWYSGVKDTIIVSMNNGVSIQCTPDHRFIVGNREVEAKDLKGEVISYEPFKNTSNSKDSLKIDSRMAFVLGWFLNDGAFIKSKNNDKRFEFYFTPVKDDEPKEKILNYLKSKGYKVTPVKDREDTYRVYNLPLFFEFKNLNNQSRLPKFFWDLDLYKQKAYMKGLFSSNGYCLSTRPTVAIKLSSKLLISDIAIWLNSNGIDTSCAYSKPVTTQHHNGVYTSKSTATLTIPHFTNKIKFEEMVGFEQSYKSDRLRQIIEKAKNTTYNPKPVKCLYIEESEKLPVWDFNEPLENVGYINGVLVHNCAFVLSDRPIQEDIPVMEVSGIKRVAQPQHSQVEWAGLMKYDFLTISCALDVELALKYINKDQKLETGYLNHKGEKRFIWDLPEDQNVFKMLSDGKTETVFQLNTVSVTPFVKKIKPKNITDLAVVTSLVRPGPLDFTDEKTGRNMAEEYIERRFGRSKGDNEVLNSMIPETYGVFVFQEQITKVVKALAKWDDEKAESVREAVGKKKLKLVRELEPQFVQSCVDNGLEKSKAQEIWDMIATFGRYGFNKSHAVAYTTISYACAFLKYHYPLEWWAAVLSNASTKEVNEVLYRYTKDLLLPPDINLSTEQITIDHKQGKLRNRLSMINGVGSKAANNIIAHRPYKDIYDFVSKKVCGPSLSKKLIHVGVLDSLFKDEKTLEEKILSYEKAVAKFKFNQKLVEYDEKIANAKDDKEVKKVEKLKERYINKGVKEVDADPEYMLLSAKKDFLMKKAVFPTINIDLNKILQRDSSTKILQGSKFPLVFDQYGKEIYMFSGEQLQTLDDRVLTYDLDFCVPGYVIDTSEFSYHNNTKKAFKLVIDSSGYISEKVIWPDYETGQLHYDENLKKGCMAFFFYNKRAGKPYTNIKHVIIEEKAL